MVDRGARHLFYLSRSGASSEEALAVISELSFRGVETHVYKGDVSILEDVQAFICEASCGHQIKGVINAAMVLEASRRMSAELSVLRSY